MFYYVQRIETLCLLRFINVFIIIIIRNVLIHKLKSSKHTRQQGSRVAIKAH